MTRKITRLDRETGQPVDAIPIFVDDELDKELDDEQIVRVTAGELREATPADRSGVWVAYYADWSSIALFVAELDALRHAVQSGMQVGYAPYGVDLFEWAVNRVTGGER